LTKPLAQSIFNPVNFGQPSTKDAASWQALKRSAKQRSTGIKEKNAVVSIGIKRNSPALLCVARVKGGQRAGGTRAFLFPDDNYTRFDSKGGIKRRRSAASLNAALFVLGTAEITITLLFPTIIVWQLLLPA
jgi:hypothetical protein